MYSQIYFSEYSLPVHIWAGLMFLSVESLGFKQYWKWGGMGRHAIPALPWSASNHIATSFQETSYRYVAGPVRITMYAWSSENLYNSTIRGAWFSTLNATENVCWLGSAQSRLGAHSAPIDSLAASGGENPGMVKAHIWNRGKGGRKGKGGKRQKENGKGMRKMVQWGAIIATLLFSHFQSWFQDNLGLHSANCQTCRTWQRAV